MSHKLTAKIQNLFPEAPKRINIDPLIFVLGLLTMPVFGVEISVHPETGDPILAWECSLEEGEHFNIYRANETPVLLEEKVLLTTHVRGKTYFDHLTRPGTKYYYRIAKKQKEGGIEPVGGEAQIVSKKNCYSVLGQMPIVMGWAYPSQELVQLGINLLFLQEELLSNNDFPLYGLVARLPIDQTPPEQFLRIRQAPRFWGWNIYDESTDSAKEKAKIARIRQGCQEGPTFGNAWPGTAFGPMARVCDIHGFEHYWSKSSFPAFVTPLAAAASTLVMGEKMALAGDWKFIAGIERQHAFTQADFDDSAWKTVQIVGSGWDKYWQPKYAGSGFYRKRFIVPPKFRAKNVYLMFEGIDEEAEIFLNGKHIGSHRMGEIGWNIAYDVDVNSTILFGEENILFVEVFNTKLMGGLYAVPFLYQMGTSSPPSQENVRLERPLYMCFRVAAPLTVWRRETFLISSVITFLAYGGKGIYYWEWVEMSENAGARKCPRGKAAIALISHHVHTWGRHLLQATYRGELKSDAPMDSSILGPGNFFERKESLTGFAKLAPKKSPNSLVTWLSHPKGHFIFILPMEEIGYHAKRIEIELPNEIQASAKAYRLHGWGLEEVQPFKGKVQLSDVRGFGILFFSQNEGFMKQIRDDIAGRSDSWQKLLSENIELNAKDVQLLSGLLTQCGIPNDFSSQANQLTASLKNMDLKTLETNRFTAEECFQAALAQYLKRPSPYPEAEELAIEAAISESEDPMPDDKLLSNYIKGARANSTFSQFRFKLAADEPNLVLGKAAWPADSLLEVQGTEWASATGAVEPYPVLTINLPAEQEIGRVRIKLPAPGSAAPDGFRTVEHRVVLAALEFPASKTACLYRLQNSGRYQELRFAPKKEKAVNLVVLKVTPEKTDAVDDIGAFRVSHVEVLSPDEKCPANNVNEVPLSRQAPNRQPLSRFGW